MMMTPALVLSAVLLVAAAASTEPEQTPGSNITVTQCHAQLDPPASRIGYTNTAKVAAAQVEFTIEDSAGTVQVVTDRGNFAPATPITHVFKLPQDVSPLGLSSARCIVTKVVYADGTTWTNPNPK